MATVRHQPLLHVLVDTAEQTAAGDGDFGGEPADGFHPMRLAQPVLSTRTGVRSSTPHSMRSEEVAQADRRTRRRLPSFRRHVVSVDSFPFEPRHRSMSQDRSFGDSKTAAAKSAPRSSSAERRPTRHRQQAIRLCQHAVFRASEHRQRRLLEQPMIVRSTLLELLPEPSQLIGLGLQNFALPRCDLELLDACLERDAQLLDVVLASSPAHAACSRVQTVERPLAQRGGRAFLEPSARVS